MPHTAVTMSEAAHGPSICLMATVDGVILDDFANLMGVETGTKSPVVEDNGKQSIHASCVKTL